MAWFFPWAVLHTQTHMSDSHESPDAEQNKYRNEVLEFRFHKMKNHFEDKADGDDQKVEDQKKLRKKFENSKSCHFDQIFNKKNPIHRHTKKKKQFI